MQTVSELYNDQVVENLNGEADSQSFQLDEEESRKLEKDSRRQSKSNVKTTTAAATTTVPATTATTEEAIQACFNGPLTLHCELVTNLSAVYELHWKIKLPGTGWNEFSYCNKSSTNCIVTRPMLPEGIKVLNNSYGSVTLERITKNNTNGHAQTLCEVHYSDNSVTSHIYEINFNVRCVWIQKGRDLNLTRILLSMLSCERVVDIDWYSINGSKFAYCNSCQGCTKTKSTDDNHIPVLWNRLQVARGLLLLTRIQESDDGLTVRVEVHLKTSGKLTGRDFSTKKESVRQYTIRILVNISRGPPDEENKTLSTAPAKVCCVGANFPCKPKQIHWNNTEGKSDKCLDCPDCPAGSQPSVACGSSVKFGKPVYCVSCELGKTYSDKYDNAQCKACKKCSKGKAVKKNCTLFTNTECDTKCGHGFYTFPLISSCLPCKQCCNDGKDKFATECMNNKNKCKARHRRCAHVHAMSSKPRDRDSVTLPTTQPVPLEGEITTMSILFSEISEKLRTFITPTWSVDNKALTGEAVETGKQDGTSLVVILLTVALAMCLVVSSLVIAKKVILGKDFLRSSREQNLDHGGNNSIQRQPPPRSQWSASHTSGQVSASSFLNRPESSQPNPSESPPSSRSASPLLIRPESSQSNRPESPKISGSAGSPLASASPRADGSTLPQPNGYTSPQLNRSASHHPSWAASAQFCRSARQQIDDVTLEELEDNNMELFDWVCTRLDNGRVGFRRDYERLASKYKIIPTEAHNSLRNESLSEGFMMDGRTLTEEQKRKKREKDRERQREKRGRTTEEQHEAEIERRREVTRNRTEEQREARRKREREIRRNSTAENALLPYVPVSTMGKCFFQSEGQVVDGVAGLNHTGNANPVAITATVVTNTDFSDLPRSSREQNSDNGSNNIEGNNIARKQPSPWSQWPASYTSVQDTASFLFNRPEFKSTQPSQCESPSSSGSASPLLNPPESSQSNRPESLKVSGSAGPPLGSASPRADGSTLSQPDEYTSPQQNRSASHQPRLKPENAGEPDGISKAQPSIPKKIHRQYATT
ncbi:hypothetical protein ACROYT_G018213 [Oculina patagonica]